MSDNSKKEFRSSFNIPLHALALPFRRFITNNIRKKIYATGKRDGLNFRFNFIVVIIITFVSCTTGNGRNANVFVIIHYLFQCGSFDPADEQPRQSMSVQI